MNHIPCIVSHGITLSSSLPLFIDSPLKKENYYRYFELINKYNFTPITYSELELVFSNKISISKPLLIDFDHAAKSIFDIIFPMLNTFGFKANIFLNTETLIDNKCKKSNNVMEWDEIGKLHQEGWNIGSHTHTHPNLSELSLLPNCREKIIEEFEICDNIIKKQLGIVSQDFAFTGNSWATSIEDEVKKRYRFARLWIIGDEYEADGSFIKINKLLDNNNNELNSQNRFAYLSLESDRYRIPGFELQKLIYEYNIFENYLKCSSKFNL